MNVSESIDWKHSTPSELFLHRFVAITKSGQTLDGSSPTSPKTAGGSSKTRTTSPPSSNRTPTATPHSTPNSSAPSTCSRRQDERNYINHHRFLH
uniref:Uncharacterized protein n=1 Tax=Siphoviridae sp. ctDCt3 TaxID=2825385 RepID=A0A8S5U272_9CAUD|nr:MAG TPA: hypothetical protein [Siphoviridae sp. ctDCt3]